MLIDLEPDSFGQAPVIDHVFDESVTPAVELYQISNKTVAEELDSAVVVAEAVKY